MARFSIRNPYFVIVFCLILSILGVTTLVRMPVDLFPEIKLPMVVVATFYSGMPPGEIESDITGRFERFFTLASGVDHMESRSLSGVSIIKVYFQAGVNPDSAASNISNLAMANMRRLPPGTLPPVVLKMDASAMPVCLISLKGEGFDETRLRDVGYYTIRNQIAGVKGASVPQPFGGKTRQIMVYVDPAKLEANELSLMDVVRSLNESNLILPAGEVRIGPYNYALLSNSQAETVDEIANIPIKANNGAIVRVKDIGEARDAQQIQTNVVRVDGQRSVYLPVLKQGGDSNTIAIVDAVKTAVANLLDIPPGLQTRVVFDQSEFVKKAIRNLLDEGALGLVLTSLMILIFIGSLRATVAVLLSIPLSTLATFLFLGLGGDSVNTMVLGGLALAFSRLIDNSVVVLENIHRHLEMEKSPEVAAEDGGNEVALPVLAATLTTMVVFLPVTLLFGVSKYLFTALALTVVLALMASYLVAMTVVPLYCSRFLKASDSHPKPRSFAARFNRIYEAGLDRYATSLRWALHRPIAVIAICTLVFVSSLALYPRLMVSFFPRTDSGQILINVKAKSGSRIEVTDRDIATVEGIIRRVVPPDEMGMVISNIGINNDFSALYSPNSGQHMAVIQVSLAEGHRVGMYEYMDRIRQQLAENTPQLSTFLQSGGIVDSVLNMGMSAPIDIQVSGSNLEAAHRTAHEIAARVRSIPGVSETYIPQDIDSPALRLDVDRNRAAMAGISEKEVVQNVITALASNQMIAPSFWVDPKSGNDYLLTVQYPEKQVKSIEDVHSIPLRGTGQRNSSRLIAVTDIHPTFAPTEIAHYQIRRVVDVFVGLKGEDLGRAATAIDKLLADTKLPTGVRVTLRGAVLGMRASFVSFGYGLLLSLLLLYLVLVAQFRSFRDPLLILLAVPLGVTGVLLVLYLSGTPFSVMSLMGMLMMTGIVVSNSILIVDFANKLRSEGLTGYEAIAYAARIRLRPILMTSLATLIGLLPMALKLGEGSESYAPLARAILGGLTVSLLFTVYLVPAVYAMLFRGKERPA